MGASLPPCLKKLFRILPALFGILSLNQGTTVLYGSHSCSFAWTKYRTQYYKRSSWQGPWWQSTHHHLGILLAGTISWRAGFRQHPPYHLLSCLTAHFFFRGYQWVCILHPLLTSKRPRSNFFRVRASTRYSTVTARTVP